MYDLLRVCVYGSKYFCQDFLTANPGYYIIPLKLNGSAIEILFAQMKFNANGKLSSANYATAKKAIMLKKDIHGQNYNRREYRDMALCTQQMPLRRKDTRRAIQYQF